MTTVIQVLKKKFNKDMYTKWLSFHSYITNLSELDITKEECDNIVKTFNIVCDYTGQMLCNVVLENGFTHEECPFYNICLKGGGEGHTKYFQIYRAARDRDVELVKKLIESIPTDSITSLNIVKELI